jgi:hypothetical protein
MVFAASEDCDEGWGICEGELFAMMSTVTGVALLVTGGVIAATAVNLDEQARRVELQRWRLVPWLQVDRDGRPRGGIVLDAPIR